MKRKRPISANELEAMKRRRARGGQMVVETMVARPLIRASSLPAGYYAKKGELKGADLPTTATAFSITPTGLLLNGTQTGAGYFNRVGARIEMKSLHFRGFLSQTATAVQGFARIFIIYDRQPNGGAMPALTDIIQARDQAGTATNSLCDGINLDQRDRYQILRDIDVVLPSGTFTAGVMTNVAQYDQESSAYKLNVFIKLKGLTTHYKSSSNPCTIADINTGGLYLYCLGSNANWTVNWGARLRYTDN